MRMEHTYAGPMAAETVHFLEENPEAVFIDCRSEMEYYFVGHPVGAHHVAWNDGPDWDINPHFVGQVKKVACMNRPVVLINVLEGFEGPLDEDHHRGTMSGWRKEGLPWEQL
jgi:rhodanese-related sulfurtransferase